MARHIPGNGAVLERDSSTAPRKWENFSGTSEYTKCSYMRALPAETAQVTSRLA